MTLAMPYKFTRRVAEIFGLDPMCTIDIEIRISNPTEPLEVHARLITSEQQVEDVIEELHRYELVEKPSS